MNLEQLRELCLSFPGTTEDIKWGQDICFMVAEKMFCVTSAEGGASFKVTPEQFAELTERTGIMPAPYMARNMWVYVEQFSVLKPKEWKLYVGGSYDLIRSKLPKKTRESLGQPYPSLLRE
jgi:predicted DNA-binding protein (MmcQ/YjbR family)